MIPWILFIQILILMLATIVLVVASIGSVIGSVIDKRREDAIKRKEAGL